MKKKAITVETWQEMAEILGGPEKACQYLGQIAYIGLVRPSDVGAALRLSSVKLLGTLIRMEVIPESFIKLYKKRMDWMAGYDFDEKVRAACKEELGKLKKLSG